MKIFYKGKLVSSYGKGKKMEGRTTKYNGNLIAKYKFDKSIYDNLIPEFNAEFTNYKIVDEYLDTEDIVTTNTETITIMSYDAEPDEYGILTTEYEVENVSTFSAENIVTRSIYSTDLPTLIRFGTNWDTDNISGLQHPGLSVLEIKYINVDSCESVFRLFARCINLIKVDGVTIHSNITNTSGMFNNCNKLTSIDVSNWNTSNVTTMQNTFNGCHSLTSLDVSNWDTSSVTRMEYMFSGCYKLTSLDLSNFDTSKVTNMTEMINECYALTELNISNWHLNSEVDVTDIFKDTNVLINVIMNNSDYNSVNKIIAELPTRTTDSMGTLDIVGVDDKSQVDVTTAYSKYWNITNLIKIAEYKFNNTIYNLFPEFNTEFTDYTYEDIVDGEVTTRTIISDDLPTIVRFGTGNASSTNRESSLLEIIELKTDNLTTMSYMFSNCENLTYINSSNWNTSNVTEMIWLFVRCNSLRTVEGINNWDTKKVTNMDSVFSECRSLTSLDLSNWNTSQVADIGWMFDNCNSLISLDLSNWNTANVEYIEGIFTECSSLKEITMYNSDVNSINEIISVLPTRTTLGYMYISRDILNNANISEAESKMWRILPLGGRVKNVYINGNNISNMITKQNKKIKGIYLGNTPLL